MVPSTILDVDFRNVNKNFVAQLLGVLMLYASEMFFLRTSQQVPVLAQSHLAVANQEGGYQAGVKASENRYGIRHGVKWIDQPNSTRKHE